MKECIYCHSCLRQRWQKKFCSNTCQIEYQYHLYIVKWKEGKVTGERGIHTKSISRHIKRYLVTKFGERCKECGWKERNKFTGNIPLEIDHIDGSAENNCEKNLRLLCPNCHSLTKSYRNLNKGNGRAWRRERYVKNTNQS